MKINVYTKMHVTLFMFNFRKINILKFYIFLQEDKTQDYKVYFVPDIFMFLNRVSMFNLQLLVQKLLLSL